MFERPTVAPGSSRGHRLALAAALALAFVSRAEAVCTTPGACALDLGGTNAYVTFGNTPALGLANVTLEAWVQRQGIGATASTGTGGVTAIPLITKGRGEADGSNVDMNYFLGIRSSDGVLVADFEEGAGGASPGLNHPVAGATVLATGVWYHVAATYDGTTWRLYVNGTLDGTLAVGQPLRSDSIQHAALGSALTSTGAAQGFFDGVIDEARIWSVARTQAEILSTLNVEVSSDPNLVARWGLNEGSGTGVGDSAGTPQNGTITGANFDWVNGGPFSVNLPPAQPTLNAPADGATGVALSPTLDVSVSDPEASPLTVTFYGREAVNQPDFTVIALPDTQYYASTLNGGLPAMFSSQTQWIVDNRVARNIRYVGHLGDCVEHGNNGGDNTEWLVADGAFSLLENPLTTSLTDGIPYGIPPGNHDQTPIGDPDGASTSSYNAFFGESRFLGRGYYGGHFGTNNDNHYSLFSASGMDFIVIDLEYDTTPDADVLAWADTLLQTYATRRAIVITHNMLGTGNPGAFSTQGQAIYDTLKDNPNLFLLLGGHVPGEGRRSDTFAGNTVNSLLADYQSRTNGGNGLLRILTFKPSLNQIQVETYSPWTNTFETDADSQFTLSYDMSPPFGVIATNSGVGSGSSTQTVWPGRTAGTSYQWYATVSDGVSTTIGPVWSFTTTSNVCGNGAISGGEGCDDGNTNAGDGCSATCTVETCWACAGQPSVCAPDNGAPCSDGVFCNGADTCQAGACTGHAGDPCPGPDGDGNCAEFCDEAADACTAPDPDGGPCDDGDACTLGETCSAGVCSGGTTTVCGPCEACTPLGGCVVGPRAGCRTSTMPLKSKLQLKDKLPDTGDLVNWKWVRGGATAIGEFGDPVTSDSYTLCVFDQGGAHLVLQTTAPAGGTCGTKPCWAPLSTIGFKYSDKERTPDGVQSLQVRSGLAGLAKASVKAKGDNVPSFGLPLTLPVVAELVGPGGACWATTHTTAGVLVNDATQFKAKDTGP